MRLKPSDVNQQTFRVSFRGFDPVEVDGFLRRVSDEIERLTEEKANLEAELEMERVSRKSLEETLESTTTLQAAFLEKAKEDSRLIKEQAKLEAARTLAAAREEMEALRRDLAGLREKRSSALSELSAFAHGLSDWSARFERERGHGVEAGGQRVRLERVAEVPEPPEESPVVFTLRQEAAKAAAPQDNSDTLEIIEDILIDDPERS